MSTASKLVEEAIELAEKLYDVLCNIEDEDLTVEDKVQLRTVLEYCISATNVINKLIFGDS